LTPESKWIPISFERDSEAIPWNRKHSFVLLSNQSEFLVMFKFFVHEAFTIANHFCRFHSNLIPNRSASKPTDADMSSVVVTASIRRSFLGMHFHAVVLSFCLGEYPAPNSGNAIGAVVQAQAMRLREGPERLLDRVCVRDHRMTRGRKARQLVRENSIFWHENHFHTEPFTSQQ
jgi:hypothetical protein